MFSKTIKYNNFAQGFTTLDMEMCQLLAIEQLLLIKKRPLPPLLHNKEGFFPFSSKKISTSKKIDYFLNLKAKNTVQF
jgi:hypothetical protein